MLVGVPAGRLKPSHKYHWNTAKAGVAGGGGGIQNKAEVKSGLGGGKTGEDSAEGGRSSWDGICQILSAHRQPPHLALSLGLFQLKNCCRSEEAHCRERGLQRRQGI